MLADKLDDYVDGLLDEPEAARLAAHVRTCDTCRRVLETEQGLRASLKDYAQSSVPRPDAAFYDRALLKATREGTRRQRRRWVLAGAGGTIAAALVLWMLGAMFLQSPEFAEPPVPAIVMTLEEPRTINLVFSSATALADATMTVILPHGVEVEGFAGRDRISWMTSLREGKNILPLTLIGTSTGAGELLATLQHADDDKTFRVRVTVI